MNHTRPIRRPARMPSRLPSSNCDCLDWRVYGHVCGSLAPPSRGEPNAWREIPGLTDPAPRPEPAPGDWLPSRSHRRVPGPARTATTIEHEPGLLAAS